eukprot:7077466-Pyramimonas_sp.AAC.1
MFRDVIPDGRFLRLEDARSEQRGEDWITLARRTSVSFCEHELLAYRVPCASTVAPPRSPSTCM